MYKQEFEAAIDRTKRFDLEVPKVEYTDATLLTQMVLNQIPYIVFEAVGELGPEDVVAKCLSLHHTLLQPLCKFLKKDVYFTIGYIYVPPNYLYKISEEELRSLMKEGTTKGELDLHAWLTLPSMEILDFSLPTTIATVKGLKNGHGGVISGCADELLSGLRYHPMVVGDEFINRIGLSSMLNRLTTKLV
jgi:hypothetical protein